MNSSTGPLAAPAARRTIDIVNRSLKRRYRAERRFRFYGLTLIVLSLVFLALLFVSIVAKGYSAFWQTSIRLPIFFDPAVIKQDTLVNADYAALVREALFKKFPQAEGRQDRRQLTALMSSGGVYRLRDMVLKDPDLVGKSVDVWLPADDDIDMLIKGHFRPDLPESERRVTDKQIAWVDQLESEGRLKRQFNTTFLTAGDSREPELAGIWGAVSGSVYTLVITLILSFPIGVAAAVYLEEFAKKNRRTDLIEVNINNLAAVPSIVFGLLALAIFINILHLPRSAPPLSAGLYWP